MLTVMTPNGIGYLIGRKVDNSGVTIGLIVSHGLSVIRASEELQKQWLGGPCVTFCYPVEMVRMGGENA